MRHEHGPSTVSCCSAVGCGGRAGVAGSVGPPRVHGGVRGVTGIGPKGFSRDWADWEWTASYTGVALIPVVIAAVFAFILASRRWMRVTAVAIPVLMLLGILAVTPVGLQKRLDAQYDSAPQCVNQDMGGTVSAADWQVVEDDRLHLRALRDGLAFEVIPCTGGGIIWAGKNESCGAPCD